MSGDSFGCHTWGSKFYWHLVGRGLGSWWTPCSAQHRPPEQTCLVPSGNSVEVRKKQTMWIFHCLPRSWWDTWSAMRLGRPEFQRSANSLFGMGERSWGPHDFVILKHLFQDWLIGCMYYQAILDHFDPCTFCLSLQRRSLAFLRIVNSKEEIKQAISVPEVWQHSLPFYRSPVNDGFTCYTCRRFYKVLYLHGIVQDSPSTGILLCSPVPPGPHPSLLTIEIGNFILLLRSASYWTSCSFTSVVGNCLSLLWTTQS